jgi:hypothetical protein
MPEELDYEKISSVVEEKLAPVFRIIGEEFKKLQGCFQSLKSQSDATKDLVEKVVSGMVEATMGHQRTMLGDSIKGQYGPDLEPLDSLSQDFYGKSVTDELLDALMDGDVPEDGRDGFVKGFLDEKRTKFGKYLPPKPEEATIEETPEEEPAAEPTEETTEEEPAGEEPGEEPDSIGPSRTSRGMIALLKGKK